MDNSTSKKLNTDISSSASGKRLPTASTSSPNLLKPTNLSRWSHLSPGSTSDKSLEYSKLKLELLDSLSQLISDAEDPLQVENIAECSIRKRNVNWHSPIHKYANATTTTTSTPTATATQEKQQQTSPQSISTTSSTHTSQVGDNSSISSGSSNGSPKKKVRIDECVQEFYDDLISRTIEPMTLNSSTPPRMAGEETIRGRILNVRRTVGEDDGFESLNGKSSSGEDTNASPQLTKNQLRLRINALDSIQLTQLNEVGNQYAFALYSN